MKQVCRISFFGVVLVLCLTPLIGAEEAIAFENSSNELAEQPISAVDAESEEWKAELAKRSGWWSLLPPRGIDPPRISAAATVADPVDRFLLKALKDAKLSQAKPANAETLLRRLSFVLTGLPAEPNQLESFRNAFAKDATAAVAALVDELLASPHFGERFARHWMDVVRYTDTYGYEWDNPAKGSWEYRDYLIRAFNQDVGFDQLIREHIAGDLLAEPRINRQAGVNESIIGPMFFHMGEHRHETSLQFNGVHQEMINNKIDAFSKTFLAMTVACARCHDHKIDAISQRDYYALAGVFMSPRWTSRVIDAPGKYDAEIDSLKRIRASIHQEVAQLWETSVEGASLATNLQHWARQNEAYAGEVKLEDIANPLTKLVGATDENVVETWNQLVEDWQTERDSRKEGNTEKFSYVTQFQKPGFPGGWTVEGDGMKHGYVRDGIPLVSVTGDSLIDELLPRGYHTHALSSKLAGALRLPDQANLPGRFVSLELRGGEWAGHITIPQNAFQNESVAFFPPDSPSEWITIEDSKLKNGVTRIYAQVVTAPLNPNFPPRVPKAVVGDVKLPAEDDAWKKRSWYSLTGIVTHDDNGGPVKTLQEFNSLYAGTAPITVKEAWDKIAGWFAGSIERWTSNQTSTEDVRLINWLLKENLIPNSAREVPEIFALVNEYREVEARIGFPRTVNSMDERGGIPMDYKINLRGSVYDEGPGIPRNFLGVFEGNHHVGESKSSGRLELANYLSSSDNPQTARVYVNRIWHWVFGTGLVATPNDFGKLGDRPSHPELLDWLSTIFMKEGWSTKQLVRRLVLTQTFCQSGEVDPRAAEQDPENRLLHHYPTRRLEAEAIRDSLLAVSGRLNTGFYGPPINPVRSVEDPLKRLLSGPLDGKGRRSIYLEMSIMDPPKFLMGFNLPNPKLSSGRRDVTNVPAQALLLLNHPLVTEMAERWAEHLVADSCATPRERIERMFAQAFSRTARDSEIERWAGALEVFAQDENVMKDTPAWAEMAHALFNTKEFIYYR